MAREDLCDLLRMGSEKQGKIQQVFCYSTGDETAGGGVGSGEQREGCASSVYLLDALAWEAFR